MSRHLHEPKIAALLALQAGALSEAGRARLQRHLADCQTCRQARAAIASYGQLRTQLRDLPPPEVDYAGMALPLRRAMGGAASAGSGGALALTALAVAAAALLWLRPWAAVPGPESPTALAPAPPALAPAPAMPLPSALATLAAGAILLDGEPMSAQGHPIAEGSRLSAPAGGAVHLRLGPGTGIVVDGGSEVVLERLRGRLVRVRLLHGSVTSRVAKRAPRARYEIVHGESTVAVRGTHFRVTEGQPPTVELAEGAVEVSVAPGQPSVQLRAPARWPVAETARPAPPPGLPSPFRIDAGGPEATLGLPALEGVVAWHLGGDRLPGGPLRVRQPPGVVHLGAELGDGRIVSTEISLDPLGSAPTIAALGRMLHLPDTAPARRARPAPSAAELAAAVQRGRMGFQKCYEAALKRDPSLRPRVTLRVVLDRGGRVSSARLNGEVPEDLQGCVQAVARRLRFPPPGGEGLRFDAPLLFRQRP